MRFYWILSTIIYSPTDVARLRNNMKFNDVFKIVHELWVGVLLILVLFAVWDKQWAEATMWLVWLIYSELTKEKRT
jgi:hypothetical protein